MEDGHGSGVFAQSETAGVLQCVDGRAPDGDTAILQVVAEMLVRVVGVVEQALDLGVHLMGDFGAGVDATETELRIGPHLGGLASFGHEAFAQADHDGVILGKVAGEIPKAFRHGVSRDSVGVFFDDVEAGFVEVFTVSKATEKLRAQGGDGLSHGQHAFHLPPDEGHFRWSSRGVFGVVGLDIFEPEVESSKDRAGIEGPLG